MNYRKFFHTFWTGRTGRACRADSTEAIAVAVYLFTGPNSNPIGLYPISENTIATATHTTPDNVHRILQLLDILGFSKYDPSTEIVWVVEMASFQIGKLKKDHEKEDGRRKWVIAQLEATPPNPFTIAFRKRYKSSLCLPNLKRGTPRGNLKGTPKGIPGGAPDLPPGDPPGARHRLSDTETETRILPYPSGVNSSLHTRRDSDEEHTARNGILADLVPPREFYTLDQLREIYKRTFPAHAFCIPPGTDQNLKAIAPAYTKDILDKAFAAAEAKRARSIAFVHAILRHMPSDDPIDPTQDEPLTFEELH